MELPIEMSLPAHLWRWDVKRAATFRVLGYLWQFGDRGVGDVWCFHTDDQVISGCGLTNGRQLRRCLEDLDMAGLVKRERDPTRQHGFRLYNREPRAILRSEVTETVRSDRSEVTAKAVRSDRKSGQICPNQLLVSLKADQLTRTPEFELSSPSTVKPSPAKTPRKGQLTDELAADLLRLQILARVATGARLGKTRLTGPSLTPGIRKAMRARLAEGYTPDQLRQAMEARARTGGANDFGYLGTASAWAAKAIEFALGIPDDEEATTPQVHATDATGFTPMD